MITLLYVERRVWETRISTYGGILLSSNLCQFRRLTGISGKLTFTTVRWECPGRKPSIEEVFNHILESAYVHLSETDEDEGMVQITHDCTT